MKRSVQKYKQIKGTFTGKYRGRKVETLFSLKSTSYQIDFYSCEITDCSITDFETELVHSSDKIIERKYLNNVLIEFPNEDLSQNDFYSENLENVKIVDYEFTDVIKEGEETYGKIKGTAYALMSYTEEIEEEIDPPPIIIQEDRWPQPENTESRTKGPGETGGGSTGATIIREERNGCLPNILWILLGCLSLAFLVFIGLKGIAILLTIAAGMWVLYALFKRFPILGRILPFLIIYGYWGFILFAIIAAIANPHHNDSNYHYGNTRHSSTSSRGNHTNTSSGKSNSTSNTAEANDSNSLSQDELISHFLSWADYKGNLLEGTVKIWKSAYFNSKSNRENLGLRLDSKLEWNRLYSSLYSCDKSKLDSVYQMFKSLRLKNHLSDMDFLNAVVTCVQNIRYSLVLPTSCDEGSYRSSRMPTPSKAGIDCLPYITYGIQSPTEFIYNLKGDCDTRTLLLYTILSHFNFDVVVLCSLEYEHSILGINIPAFGSYKSVNGKRYYVWETTSPGWTLGQIAPQVSDMSFWDVFIGSN